MCGEPSGDRALAAVLDGLVAAGASIEATGLVGDASIARGARPLAHVRDLSGMGLVELIPRLRAIARAGLALRRSVHERAPDVAVLASWSAANARIGAWLRRRGVPVAWISPPEVWAWGAHRTARLAGCADRLLVTLPFEEALWRAAGADARYVGHPALDARAASREVLRERLGISRGACAVAVLPGSRPAELARLAPVMLGAARRLEVEGVTGGPSVAGVTAIEARVLLAPSLDADARARLRSLASQAQVAVLEAVDGAPALLPAFDAALVASGTASLECALAGAAPVIAYRLHPLTAAIARRLVRLDRVGLPNVVLARAGHAPPFRECLQHEATVDGLASALRATLDDPSLAAACVALDAAMRAPLIDAAASFGARCAGAILALAQATPRRRSR